jgi:hypothetical protein
MRPDGREAKVASEPEVLIGQFGGLTIGAPAAICSAPDGTLRSVLTGTALKAAHTCRVSSNSTGNPTSRMPAYSHYDSGPASTRSAPQPRRERY